jgi:uncharacterized protein YbjQ (UPF0145 family)
MNEPVAGIPEAARKRLEELRRGRSFFTSDLSVPEFLVAREAGFKPLTQVMGSCFYNVGWQWMPGSSWQSSWQKLYAEGQTFELETQTEAWNEARRLALGRLAAEARLAGADAVVGVRIARGNYDWAAGLLEFVATGTAMRSERYDLGDEPVLSNLSGQEFAALYTHGYWPVGIVAATTVCYVMTTWQTASATSNPIFGGTSWQNQELEEFTTGVYDARARVVGALVQQRHELGAEGIIGVRYDHHIHEREADRYGKRRDLIVTVHVLGTGIAEIPLPEGSPPIYIALPLNQETR